MKVVGTGLVGRDRESFDWFYPRHLEELMQLVDHLYVRIDDDPEPVLPFLEPYGDRITWEPQADTPRFQEDIERNALLDWTLKQEPNWCFSFDADEVLEPGGGKQIRDWLEQTGDRYFRVVSFLLNYSSHHRPGYLLPVGGQAWRGYKIDQDAHTYRYQADEDGLHCGTVPTAQSKKYKCMKEVVLMHFHATNCEEYMQERAFYDNTAEVNKHGGIDLLYRCDRFGDEMQARPESEWLSDRDERYERLMAWTPS